MVAPTFYNTLYGINYRLPNVTSIVAVGIYSVAGVVERGSNHDLDKRKAHFSSQTNDIISSHLFQLANIVLHSLRELSKS